MPINKAKIVLLLIILLAFFLRFYKLEVIPPSLNWDEASIGYNAYSILKTGKDEWGKTFPLHFKAYGEYKLPAQVYASIPGIYIFGLNEFGVRVTPLIYGVLTILLIFLIGKEMFQNKLVGLVSAFLLAISPWHIQLTRASFESSFSLFWVCLGVWLLIRGFKNPKFLLISMTAFAMSVYTYNSARIFTPLFLISISLIYSKYFTNLKKYLLLSFFIFALLMVPLLPFILSGEGSARYKLVSITDDPGLVLRINEGRGNSNLPQPLSRIVHNKVTYVSATLLEHYLTHFTPDFLFISGAPHKQHHVQNIGQLYWIQAPFLIYGLYLLFKKKEKFRWLLLGWILISFIPVSVTNDSIPHALRTLIAVPTYQLISAFGFVGVLTLLSTRVILSKLVIISSFIFLGFQINNYLYNYFYTYPINYSRDWQYGYKQIVNFISNRYDNYDLIVFSRHYGEPHMFTLFFTQYDPEKFLMDKNLIRFETYDWIRVLSFDKYYFPDLGDRGTRYEDILAKNPSKKILFIGKPGDFPPDLPKLYEVNFLNGDSAFEVVEST